MKKLKMVISLVISVIIVLVGFVVAEETKEYSTDFSGGVIPNWLVVHNATIMNHKLNVSFITKDLEQITDFKRANGTEFGYWDTHESESLGDIKITDIHIYMKEESNKKYKYPLSKYSSYGLIIVGYNSTYREGVIYRKAGMGIEIRIENGTVNGYSEKYDIQVYIEWINNSGYSVIKIGEVQTNTFPNSYDYNIDLKGGVNDNTLSISVNIHYGEGIRSYSFQGKTDINCTFTNLLFKEVGYYHDYDSETEEWSYKAYSFNETWIEWSYAYTGSSSGGGTGGNNTTPPNPPPSHGGKINISGLPSCLWWCLLIVIAVVGGIYYYYRRRRERR